MRELTGEELNQASGAGSLPPSVVKYAPRIGKIGLVFMGSYEAATWFGLDHLGEAIGNTAYDIMHS